MGDALGVLVGGQLVQPGLKTRLADAEIVGQEAREALHLDDGQQAAGPQRGEHLAQGAVGVGHVVQGRRCPDQIHVAEVRPGLVQVRLDGTYPLCHALRLGLVPQPVQQRGRGVHGDRLGVREPLEQGEGAGTRAAAEVEQAAHGDVPGGPGGRGQPGGHIGEMRVQDFRVEVQQLGHVRLVEAAGVVVVPVTVVTVVTVVLG